MWQSCMQQNYKKTIRHILISNTHSIWVFRLWCAKCVKDTDGSPWKEFKKKFILTEFFKTEYLNIFSSSILLMISEEYCRPRHFKSHWRNLKKSHTKEMFQNALRTKYFNLLFSDLKCFLLNFCSNTNCWHQKPW